MAAIAQAPSPIARPDYKLSDSLWAGGGAIFLTGTQALVRMALWSPARHAVIAFGSPEPEGFTPDMGCELIAFVTRVVERVAERWPVLDPAA